MLPPQRGSGRGREKETTIKTAIAVRHIDFEDCGTLTDALEARGYGLRYVDVDFVDQLRAIDAEAPDLLVSLGGPESVYDEAEYPWILDELKLFERRLRSGKPTLGICFGAQVIARVLGARVFESPVKELGWKPLELTAAGRDSCIRMLGPQHTSMLHWHGDTFDLPHGATLLASTRDVENQVYACGSNVLAFQCHPEVRQRDMESWLFEYSDEVKETMGVSEAALRADTERFAPAMQRQSRIVFDEWLDALP